MALKTQKTGLWMVKYEPDESPEYSLVKIGFVTGITGIGGARDQIDTTHLESDEREYLGGFANPGAVNIGQNWDPAEVSHEELEEMYNSGVNMGWALGLSDGTSVPTLNASTGVLTFPPTRTFIKFDGYIADYPLNLDLNDAMRAPMVVQRSGRRAISRKSS